MGSFNTIYRKGIVNPSYICHLDGIFEGYEDIAVMRTLNPQRGEIEFLVAEDFLADFDEIIVDLQKNLPLHIFPLKGKENLICEKKNGD